ncbi:MAG TPA: cobalt ABC transporter ATP-binding protein, partial [Firmicutes bacterium]|nr:cobalt ABC transporter ATP-binding protein [Bacillota bacterium]
DEPTTGLDYQEQRRMMELVKRLNEKGHTIIMITHTMWVVAEYAHRIALMRNGLLTMCGATRAVLRAEGELASACLKVPQIVKLSNLLGHTALSVEELLYCTVRAGE